MAQLSSIREHMKVIGADGVPVGTVDRVEGSRIKLTLDDSGRATTRAITTISPVRSSPISRVTRCGSALMRMSP